MKPCILPYKNIHPQIPDSVFVAQNAAIIGDVEIGEDSNIWYSVTIRGDVHEIRIGARTNIQDGSVIHVTSNFQGTYIGDDVTVGHMALLHACRVGNRCLVGMGSIMLDGAVMEEGSMLAAGSLLTPGKVVPTGQLWAGRPAKFMRDLTAEEIGFLSHSAKHYVAVSRAYMT
jgi:carbonic anhydrase/acetyltransferase-like protein (isoleucine patch superfamily)